MKKVLIADATLCRFEESNRNPLLFREKKEIAAMLDSCGIDIIELPTVNRPKEDSVIFSTIAASVKRASVAVRAETEEGLASAYRAISGAVSPILEVALPVSTVQMEYRYHLKNEAMLAKISALCSVASSLCKNVLFVAEDATRAETGFLIEACRTAIRSGSNRIMICDSAGICTPEDMSELIKLLRSDISCPLLAEVSDDLHMASAIALAAVKAGADGLRSSSFGGGILSTPHIADLLFSRGSDLGLGSGLDYTRIHRDIMQVIAATRAETGSDRVNAETDSIFLDGGSTLADIQKASETLGYSLTDEDVEKVYASFLKITSKKGTLGSRELEALIAASAMQVPATYHLTGYNVSCSNITSSMAHVVLGFEGRDISGLATGDGPIDAAFRAIEQLVGFHYELEDFQIRAVTEGKESLGETLVKLRCDGKLYSGSGLSTDIVGASIRAYVNALNKIVAGE